MEKTEGTVPRAPPLPWLTVSVLQNSMKLELSKLDINLELEDIRRIQSIDKCITTVDYDGNIYNIECLTKKITDQIKPKPTEISVNQTV